MRKILYGLLLALFAGSALAADNAVVLTPGSGVTMRTKDVGALVQSPFVIPGDTAGAALATAPGTPNASFALPIQGVTSGTPVPISGTVATSGTTTVSGTVTANQGGTWTVQPGNTANTTPWLFQGNVSNASSGVATGSISVPTVSYNYGFNGTTWDRVQTGTYGSTPSGAGAISTNTFVTNTNANGRTTSGANASPVVTPSAPNSGATAFPIISAASTNANSIKTSATVVFACQFGNNGTSPVYVKIYNKASAPTVGSDTPVKTLIVPGPSAGGGGSNPVFGPGGFALSLGFALAITGGIQNSDTTAISANAVVVNCDYE